MVTVKHVRSLIFVLSFLTVGCVNSELKAAKTTVIVIGQAWMELDSTFAPAYEQARIHARDTSSTWQERDQKLEKWEAARKALVSSGLAVKTAALAVSIAEDGYTSDWQGQLKKTTEAIKSMCQALQVIGMKVPDAILKFTEIIP